MKAKIEVFIVRSTYRKATLFEGDLPEESYAQIVEIEPRQRIPKHYHEKQYELFYIISGEAKLGIGEVEYDARPGDIYLLTFSPL